MKISGLEHIIPVAEALRDAGGRLCLVGGVVRDHFLCPARQASPLPEAPPPDASDQDSSTTPPDLDFVAFGLDLERLLAALAPFGQARPIGRRTTSGGDKLPALAHLRMGKELLEISPPRRLLPEARAAALAGSASGQKLEDELSAFLVPTPPMAPVAPAMLAEFSPQASPLEDALARDFSVNAIFYDILADEFEDPLGGIADVERKVLRLCHPLGFVLDPLRLLRAFAFLSRYALEPSPELTALAGESRALLASLPKGRFWPEWRKWALGSHPQLGLKFLEVSGLLDFWPQLAAMRGTLQNPRFHPEGDVWQHTLLTVEAMASLSLPDACDKVALCLAALLHDVGKPIVTRNLDGRWISHGHAQAGLEPTLSFLEESILAPQRVVRPVLKLVERHMDVAFKEVTAKSIRRLARKLEPEVNLAEFWALAWSDYNGRGPSMRGFPISLEDFLAPLRGELRLAPPLLQGRDLLTAFPGRVRPGQELGALLSKVNDAADADGISSKADALALAEKLLDAG